VGFREISFITKKGLKRGNTPKAMCRGEEGFIERKRYTPIQDGAGLSAAK
jgi:hypothetical protein